MSATEWERVIRVATEAGIALTTVIALAVVFVFIVRYLTSLNKSQSNQWDDFAEISRQQLEVQREGFQTLERLTTSNIRIEQTINQRFDQLESKVNEVASNVRRVLLLIGEETADG